MTYGEDAKFPLPNHAPHQSHAGPDTGQLRTMSQAEAVARSKKCVWRESGDIWAFRPECRDRGTQINPEHITYCPYCSLKIEFAYPQEPLTTDISEGKTSKGGVNSKPTALPPFPPKGQGR